MPLRRVEIVVLVAAFAAGAALRPEAISADAGRVLVTFFGLVAASILPTITLLINSMTASGRSTQSIKRLEKELNAAMDALFLLFGSVVIAVAALLTLSIESPKILGLIPHLREQILPRIGQAVLVEASTLIIWRIGQIPGILRRTLKVRYEIALDEARNKLSEKAPDASSIRQAFATRGEFGKVVSLQELQNQDNR